MPHTINIEDIHIPPRDRTDLGDIPTFAESLRTGMVQPIVLKPREGGGYELLAGNRRLKGLIHLGHKILYYGASANPEKPGFVFSDALSPEAATLAELVENIHRKDQRWDETVKAVCKLHQLYRRDAVLAGKKWTLEDTADLIGYGVTYVSNCMLLAPKLTEYADCETITDAVKRHLKEVEDAAVAELSRRTLAQTTPSREGVSDEASTADAPIDATHLTSQTDAVISPLPCTVRLSDLLINADCLDYMSKMPPESVDHCITDWPYAIDVENMEQQTGGDLIERIKDTHKVAENLELYKAAMPLIYRALRPGGFFLAWHDAMHFRFLHDLGIATGFRVQRWPIIGVKAQARNSAAQYNITKATEQVIVFSKLHAILPKVVPLNWFFMPLHEDGARSNPFAKSFDAWKFLIEAVSLPGQTIFDPFAGEGSCQLACLRLDRRILAVELDKQHYDYMVLNVSEHFKERYPNVTFA